jgi:hypothetical protein
MLAPVARFAAVFGINYRFDCTATLMRQAAVAIVCAEEVARPNVVEIGGRNHSGVADGGYG